MGAGRARPPVCSPLARAGVGRVRGAPSTLPYISSRFSAAAQDAETVENQKVGGPHRQGVAPRLRFGL